MLPPAHRGAHLALRALQLGALLVALAALRHKPFELDRFFVPKELVLHATALVVCIARLGWPAGDDRAGPGSTDDGRTRTRTRLTLVDAALAGYLLLSLASALGAPNRWLAARALALSASSIALFWGARAVARAGLARPLLAALALAVAVGAGTSLLQAYGVESVYFSVNRAPGGTFGNRNFVAHLAAIGLPLLACVALRARVAAGALAAALGTAVVAAVLVLSRSRGAWLASAAALLPLAVGMWRARRLPGARAARWRTALVVLAAAAGATAALTLPNTLAWRSDSPYLDSVRGVVDYRGGSGRGRLEQYANSARMALAHPVLGVGPGNWAVRYPRHAPAADPSLAGDGTTANPWPSSDWVAVLSERGVPAFLALGAAVLGLLWWAHRVAWRAPDADRALLGGVFGAVLTATVVVGAFDAVLLLAAPAFIAWAALGVLAVESGAPDAAARPVRWPATPRRLALAALAAAGALGSARALAQGTAMALFGTGRASSIAAAGTFDPGSYRIRLRQAELAAQRGRCAEVRRHAAAAHALLPEAAAPRRLAARCRGTRRR